MSILSRERDGLGFFYGFHPEDSRQINVRSEADGWVAYVGGERIGAYVGKEEAEAAAVDWIKAHPADAIDEPELPMAHRG